MMGKKLAGAAFALAVTSACSHPASQAPVPARGSSAGTSSSSQTPNANGPAGGVSDSTKPPPSAPKPYPKVITREAKTRSGMF